MGNSSGKKRRFSQTNSITTSTIETITKLQDTIGKMEKREAFLSKKAMSQLKLAKAKNRAGQKKEAIHCLRRQKMYIKQIDRIKNTKLNLQTQIMTLENAEMNRQTIDALQTGEQQMKKLVNKGNIEELEDLRESIEEHHQTNEEISAILSEPMGTIDDDDEFEEELEGLLEEEIQEKLLTINKIPTTTPQIPSLPKVPQNTPQQELSDEQKELKELKELENSMAMV